MDRGEVVEGQMIHGVESALIGTIPMLDASAVASHWGSASSRPSKRRSPEIRTHLHNVESECLQAGSFHSICQDVGQFLSAAMR